MKTSEKDQKVFRFEPDYFSYAVFAFYIFNNTQQELVKLKTIFYKKKTIKHHIIKKHTLNDSELEMDDESSLIENEEEVKAELEKQMLKYARRMRNNTVLFRTLLLFTIELGMLIFIILYYY